MKINIIFIISNRSNENHFLSLWSWNTRLNNILLTAGHWDLANVTQNMSWYEYFWGLFSAVANSQLVQSLHFFIVFRPFCFWHFVPIHSILNVSILFWLQIKCFRLQNLVPFLQILDSYASVTGIRLWQTKRNMGLVKDTKWFRIWSAISFNVVLTTITCTWTVEPSCLNVRPGELRRSKRDICVFQRQKDKKRRGTISFQDNWPGGCWSLSITHSITARHGWLVPLSDIPN